MVVLIRYDQVHISNLIHYVYRSLANFHAPPNIPNIQLKFAVLHQGKQFIPAGDPRVQGGMGQCVDLPRSVEPTIE